MSPSAFAVFWLIEDQQRIDRLTCERRECGVDIVGRTQLDRSQRDADTARRRLDFGSDCRMERERWIEQVRDARRFRDYFPEQLQLLRVPPGAQSAPASDVAAGPGQARDEPRPDRACRPTDRC